MEDAEYWKRCTLWLADVMGTTAEREIGLKSTARSAKLRHARIAAIAARALRGEYRPVPRDQESILKLLDAIPRAETL